MEVKSTTKYVRLSPKKARDVAREIQGLPVSSALDILTFTPKKAAFHINKTLKTAIADAENNFSLSAETLIVKEATIGAGPVLKRFSPRAKGSAGGILKRTSHIFITLAEAPEGDAKPKRVNVSKKAADKQA
jgi:large subunit ribosomal protein L22